MNKNQVKGAVKDVGGKIQQGIGKVTGSAEQQARGIQKQVEGKLQRQVGNLQEAGKDASKQ